MPIRRPYALAPLWFALAAAAGCAAGPPPPPDQSPAPNPQDLTRHQFDESHMGTRFRLVLYAPDQAAARAAADAAFARIGQLNSILSDYDPDSELSRLSDTAGDGRPIPLSDDLWNVLDAAQRFAELSGGAFDITVGPATRVWRRAHQTRRLPHPSRIERVREAIGHQHLELDPDRRTATLHAPNMRLDPGGIGKGYAADEALDVLRRHGVTRALVAGGGDIALGDPPPGEDGWRIALQPVPARPGEPAGRTPDAADPPDAPGTDAPDTPDGSEPGTTHYLLAGNLAVSTSGDAFQHVVIDGTRYSHLVDPKTGIALTTPLAVTTIAPDATTADALASAISVLGPEAGLALADSIPGAAAMIAVLDADGGIGFHRSRRIDELNIEPAGRRPPGPGDAPGDPWRREE